LQEGEGAKRVKETKSASIPTPKKRQQMEFIILYKGKDMRKALIAKAKERETKFFSKFCSKKLQKHTRT
jgi:hypothetical protein